MAKIARVLVGFHLEGNEYRPDQVLELNDDLAKALKEAGYIDPTKAAVEDSMNRLGMKIIKHSMTEEEAERIAATNAAIAAAAQPADDGKAGEAAV